MSFIFIFSPPDTLLPKFTSGEVFEELGSSSLVVERTGHDLILAQKLDSFTTEWSCFRTPMYIIAIQHTSNWKNREEGIRKFSTIPTAKSKLRKSAYNKTNSNPQALFFLHYLSMLADTLSHYAKSVHPFSQGTAWLTMWTFQLHLLISIKDYNWLAQLN